MAIIATIMNATTGQPIQKMTFGRMPTIGAGFVLESGERVTAQRVEVRKPAPGKFISPVDVWVAPGAEDAPNPWKTSPREARALRKPVL